MKICIYIIKIQLLCVKNKLRGQWHAILTLVRQCSLPGERHITHSWFCEPIKIDSNHWCTMCRRVMNIRWPMLELRVFFLSRLFSTKVIGFAIYIDPLFAQSIQKLIMIASVAPSIVVHVDDRHVCPPNRLCHGCESPIQRTHCRCHLHSVCYRKLRLSNTVGALLQAYHFVIVTKRVDNNDLPPLRTLIRMRLPGKILPKES